jgi:N-glycosidase YbiA
MTVCFYRTNEKFGELSNFFVMSTPLLFQGKPYMSSEHLYHALKFLGPVATSESKDYAELIRQAKTPNIAKILARQRVGGGYPWRTALNATIRDSLARGVRPRADWDAVKVERMRMVLMLKFQQNATCRAVLLSTGNASISEHTSSDLYWGDGGAAMTGGNHLGRLLVEVRGVLRGAAKRKFFGDDDSRKQRCVNDET